MFSKIGKKMDYIKIKANNVFKVFKAEKYAL